MKARPAVSLTLALFAFAAATVSTSAEAAKTKLVSIGEIVSAAPKGKAKLDLVRSALEQELDSIDWRKSTRMKPYVVSVSVVTLETETTRDRVATTCELSTTIRSAKSGSVVAIVNQRVRAENGPAYARAVEDGAVRAAASAAIRKIPDALRAKAGS
jgi:hypothetical protein